MKLWMALYAAAALAFAAGPESAQPPVGPQSGMPFLASAPDGSVYLSWIDPVESNQHALRFSRWDGTRWSAAETIAQGSNWFVNWADFPSIDVLPDGGLLAHWLTRSNAGSKFGYGIRIAKRDPGAKSWREIHGMSLDEPSDYAGFLAFVPGESEAIYLAPPAGHHAGAGGHDGETHEEGHRKTARYIAFTGKGTLDKDIEVDADTCSCCQTAIARTSRGLIAAYRDHRPGEIRDISVIRLTQGGWTQPRTLNADGWKINGCPTDGPSIAARQSQVAIAWLTRANDSPKVQASLSHDGGETFSPPLRLDSGNPLGRPSIIALNAGAMNPAKRPPAKNSGYIAVWLEKTAGETLEVRVRRIREDGSLGTPRVVAQAPAGRAAGFPKIAATGNQLLVVWRDQQVRATFFDQSELD